MDKPLAEHFLPFYSAAFTRTYLTEAYEQLHIPQAKAKSYHTCYSFIYHLQQGELYLKQAHTSPVELKPLLLFYGFIQLLKACILTRDPDYPQNSDVLAHGVSTRKRKKAAYCFLDDEVKVQKNGLFSHLLDKMFHMKHGFEKYQMRTLLQHIADLHPLFLKLYKQDLSYKGTFSGSYLTFPSKLLDSYHMTPNRFEQYIEAFPHSGYNPRMRITEEAELLSIPLHHSPSSLVVSPWLLDHAGNIYILKKRNDKAQCKLPEPAIHYLLLYNLSMISRYEAEWWGELIHTFNGADYPFIRHYLTVAEKKLPALIANFLLKE